MNVLKSGLSSLNLDQDRLFQKIKLLCLSSALFLFHFVISFRNSMQNVDHDALAVVLLSVKELYQSGSFEPWLYQTNFYTGTPFFMLPYYLLFESSPFSLRIALISLVALASVFAFLSYYNIFGLKKAILGILLLFTINSWLIFRRADFTYLALFPIICFYLFSRWDRKPDKFSLYTLAFTSGILFYFKAVVAHVMISIAAAKILVKRETFLNKLFGNLNAKKFLTSLILFIAGLYPFLMYLINQPDFLTSPFDSSSLSLLENFQVRLSDLTSLIDPMTAMNTQDTLFAFNSISILLVVSILICLVFRENLEHIVCFTTFFLLLLILPNGSGLRYGHLFALVPFIPLVVLSAYETVTEFLEKLLQNTSISEKIVENTFYFTLLLILSVNISASVAWMEHMEVLQTEPLEAGRAPAGEPQLREEKIILEDSVVTNTYSGALYALYDFDVERVYFIGNETLLRGQEEWRPDLDDALNAKGREKWNYQLNALERFNAEIIAPERVPELDNLTFIFSNNLECPEVGCYDLRNLSSEFELDKPQKKITLDEKVHHIYRK